MSFTYAQWPLPANILAGWTTRKSGCSSAPFNAFNIAHHVGEPMPVVSSNRKLLQARLAQQPTIAWLNQTHSSHVVNAECAIAAEPTDASVTSEVNLACCVMTADCLPVYFWTKNGHKIGVAHAGWRGLANGILSKTLARFDHPSQVICGLGPCIGPNHFEVGEEVKEAFSSFPNFESCFVSLPEHGKYNGNLQGLAELHLKSLGVSAVYKSEQCTFELVDEFYSFRREGQTGRMANLIWKID